MATELKPCPFCGKRAMLAIIGYGDGATYYGVTCENWRCAVASIVPNFSDKEDAMEAWNRRAEDGN